MDEKKVCPFNPDLKCEDCRLYLASGHGRPSKCVFVSLVVGQASLALKTGQK